MKGRFEQPSAVAGELSPLIEARTDLQKFQSGARRIHNMIVLPEGARSRRPGTRYVAPVKTESSRCAFVPFDAGDGDTYLLVFNGGVMRVYKNGAEVLDGGAPYEIATPFTADKLTSLRWVQSLDTLFIAWSGVPQRLQRISDINWVLADYPATNGPVRLMNSNTAATIQASAATGTVTLTSPLAIFSTNSIGSIWRIEEPAIGDIPLWRAATSLTLGAKCRWKGRLYEVIVAGDSGDTPPEHSEGDVKAGGTGGATFRFSAFDHGYARITAVASGMSATASVIQPLPPAAVAAPTYRWSEGAWCAKFGYPTAVTIVDQSLAWLRDNDVWVTETTDIYSFAQTDEEDSALNFRLLAPDGKAVTIQWAMNAGALLLGASSGEWVVRGPSAYDKLTATTSRAFLQSSEGSTPHQPVAVHGGAVFIGRSRERLGFARFDFLSERIDVQEFTTYSRQVLKAGANQLAWQQDPHRILWVLLDDGTLAAVTFMPDQEVMAWHRHTLAGAVIEEIAAVQSTDTKRTELWLQTARTINGQTRRYIEILQPYFAATTPAAPDMTGAWFVDCGLPYTGAATRTLSGLTHLEGQSVRVQTPRGDIGAFTVTGGAITLPQEVTEAVVGLPIAWATESLPLDLQTQAGSTKGKTKRASRAVLHVHEAAGGFVSANGGTEEPVNLPASLTGGADLPLYSGVVDIPIDQITDRVITLTIGDYRALPFTLLSMAADLHVAG